MEKELKHFIQNRIGDIYSASILENQGCTSTVQKIASTSGTYLLKSSTQAIYKKWLKKEAEIMKKLSREGTISIPQYYGFLDMNNGSHLLMSFEDGVTLSQALTSDITEPVKQTLVESFGTFLDALHSTHGSTLHRAKNSGWLDTQLKFAEKNLDYDETEGDADLLSYLQNNQPNVTVPTIIHGDCTPDNVLIKNNEVYLFIDIAGMTIGDPRYDETLAVRKFLNHPEFLQSFYKGYTKHQVTPEEFKYFDALYDFF